jgi:hypothetical protein
MQKRASRSGWRFAVAAIAAMVLIQLISVAGLQFSAGMMGSSRQAIGHKPTSGLWGADEGAKLTAVRGPVEHQAGLTSELTIYDRAFFNLLS